MSYELFRYLRTPAVDCRPVKQEHRTTHKSLQMPTDYLALFNDRALGSVALHVKEDIKADVCKLALSKVRPGGIVLFDGKISDDLIKEMATEAEIRKYKVGEWTIVKRLSGKNGIAPGVIVRTKGDRKSVCIVRYGGIGDHLMASVLVQYYYEQGWHITYNTTDTGSTVFKGDTRIDDLFVQEHGIIPPDERLGKYWEEMSKGYDKFINLSEVVEGEMLRVEGRKEFGDPWEKRMNECGGNYLDAHFKRAGLDVTGRYPAIRLGSKEIEWAERQVARAKANLNVDKIFLWNVMGSSFHKMYPWIFDVLARVRANKGLRVGFLTVSDALGAYFMGNENKDLVVDYSGRTSIRQSISLHSAVDGVVTPETWSLIAAFAYDAPMICLLSHSALSNYNFRVRDIPLYPKTADCPCYPCHQLHYSRKSCPDGKIEKAATLCMDQIPPDAVYEAICKIAEETSGYDSVATADHRS